MEQTKSVKKSPLWVALALLIVGAILFIRPQGIFQGTEMAVTQVSAYGRDIGGKVDKDLLAEMLEELLVSRMLDTDVDWQAEDCVVITGTSDGEAFTLVLGDNSILEQGDTTYRVRNGSDLMVTVEELMPEGESLWQD